MIKLKKYTALALCAVTLGAPLSASATEFDQKIADQDKKIEGLQQTAQSAEAQKAALEQEVAAVEKEVKDVLTKKTQEEQKLSELTAKIQDLQAKIQKRELQLKEQARNVQTNNSAVALVNTVMEAKSISEAVEKTMAVSTILSANKEAMEQQTRDKAELEKLQQEAQQRLAVVTKKTEELKVKQEQLVEAKLDQQVKVNEIQASIASETAQKDKFQQQKEDAEKKRQEALKALEEQKKKEAEAREKAQAEAEKQAKIAAEQAQKALEEAAAEQAAAENAQQKAQAEIAALEAKQQEEQAKQQAQQVQTVTNPEAAQVPSAPNTETSTPATNSGGWASPLSIGLVVTSPFGPRVDPTGLSGSQHDGIDFAGAAGTSIHAAKAGTVVEAGFHWSAGNYVIIQHSDGYYSYYMHMISTPNCSVGQQVSQGQVIGGMGTTGNSTGVHLHFGVSTAVWSGFVNPAPLLGV
ncbi:peptidoglycan DD-metalloendopeptidase family protein [Enterococcus sp. AZ163]|uniref:peptidoglycan DD-metalloendopeptidase family protein n=1 Tax=Enterococcus sp. AZ163 TaxID=2774638 RepID=UPI003D2CACD3